MYEPPSEDPRTETAPPICEYCGGEITKHPQKCMALPAEDDPSGESGYCHPDPYHDPHVTIEADV